MCKRYLRAVAPHLVWIIGLVAVPTAAVYGQGALPEFTLPGQTNALRPSKEQLQPKHWVRPVHSSLAGKSVAELALQAQAEATIPLWSGSAVYQNVTYNFQMVGQDPTKKLSNPFTSIATVLIPVKFTFQPSNVVFDPARPNSCTPRPAINMVEQSPLFVPIGGSVGGTSLGTGQFTSLFQRGNFFKYAGPSGINPHYQVSLIPIVLSEMKITVNSPLVLPASIWAGCNPLGLIEINGWDSFLQNTILPQLGRFGIGPKILPVFLFEDVALYDTTPLNCCILGYHNAFMSPTSGALQTYVVGMYDTTAGAFGSNQDIMDLTHEIAEWMDDPTTSNPTPAWGNVGQVQGVCQSTLEVGDPLTGTIAAIPMPHFTYHVQDLAFKSWFYRESPSAGVNGWYSLLGAFQTYSAPCP
jgi:hypothetical protein